MSFQFPQTAWRPLILAFLLCAIATCTGCSSSDNQLKMVSLDNKHDFEQSFSEAYVSKNATGDTDVVLVSQPAYSRDQNPRKPLAPEAVADAPRQIVHIRIYWKPMTGTHSDHPANTNASVHWYMLGDTAANPDLLEYSGTGLVDLDESSDGASMEIRTAWMKAVNHRGGMIDPLGPSKLDGSVHAKLDPDEVKSILAAVKTAAGSPIASRTNQPTNDPTHMSLGQ